MERHSFSVRRRVLGRVLASSLGRITCLFIRVIGDTNLIGRYGVR